MRKAMIRKVSAFLLLAAVFCFAGGAEAVKRTYGPLEVDVPNGWKVEETDDQLTFTAPDSSAALTIVVEILKGTTMKEVAEDMSRQLKGDAPTSVDGWYGFTFRNEHGIDCDTVVVGDEETGFYMVMMKAGDHPQMDGLINSIEWKE